MAGYLRRVTRRHQRQVTWPNSRLCGQETLPRTPTVSDTGSHPMRSGLTCCCALKNVRRCGADTDDALFSTSFEASMKGERSWNRLASAVLIFAHLSHSDRFGRAPLSAYRQEQRTTNTRPFPKSVMLVTTGYLAKRAKASRHGRLIFSIRKSLILNGGQRRDRTADAGLFRAALYH